MSAPSREAIRNLYHNMLRTSQSFSSYNFRQYFVRRTKDTFRTIQEEKDSDRLGMRYAEALRGHAVLRRSAMVNQLYGGWKVTVEAEQGRNTHNNLSRSKQRGSDS